MKLDDQVLNLQILDRKLQVKCPLEKAEDLQQAAYFLDGKMREIRNSGKAIGNESIAMMAALNIAYDLMTVNKQKDTYLESMASRIKSLTDKIDQTLAQDGQMEL